MPDGEKDLIDKLDEMPPNAPITASIFRHFMSNHFKHLQGDVDVLKAIQTKVILPILLLILAAIVGLIVVGVKK
jgi:hypothetical protein